MSRRQIDPSNWNPEQNGDENTYMQFTSHWKKEIIEWSKDCIREIKNKMYQLDQINYVAADDLRHSMGMTIGRILEIHRQQVDMYRRMKRIVENRFNWIRPELAGKFPQLWGQDGVVEPSENVRPDEFDKMWARGGSITYYDYKPHVYILALEYITKRETQIEHLVKLLTEYTGEEEVGRFRPNNLIGEQGNMIIWNKYSKVASTPEFVPEYWQTNMWRSGQQVPNPGGKNDEEDKQHEKEEQLKAKMRAEYFKKRGSNKK